MATTTNYSIYYPVASDSVAPLHTAFSTLATSVETALTNNLKPLSDNVENYSYIVATTSEMNALTSVPAGSMAFVTADKSSYQYNGLAWVLMYRPWTSPTPPTIANFTVNTYEYMVSDNVVHVNFKATVATAPSFTSFSITNPLTGRAILDANAIIGSGVFVSGASSFPLAVQSTSTTASAVKYLKGSPVSLVNIATTSNTNPAQFAVGSSLSIKYSYPLA